MELVIVGEVRLYREGLARVLGRFPDVHVAACTAAEDAVAAARKHHPDLVLVDVGLADGRGVVARICAEVPGVRLVVVAMPETDADVIAWAEAGVAGFVTRDASLKDLAQAIRSVSRGECLCSPRIAAALLSRVAKLGTEQVPEPELRLTRRERQIVSLIDQGLSNKEIARSLSIELSTVKSHVHSVLEKLRVNRRGEAVARMRREAGAPPLRSSGSGI